MANVYTKDFEITPGSADHSSRLSLHGAFPMFMDAAAEHGRHIGVGCHAMEEKGLFWVTVRTKLRFFERPVMEEMTEIRTWPEAPGKVRCVRSYELRSKADGRLLVAGKTEWAVFDFKKQSVVPLAGVFPEETDYYEHTAIEEPFTRIADDFEGIEPFGEYVVRSTDIDLGRHMNNAAYPRAVLGAFSCREIDELDPKGIEVLFKRPCFEGDRLVFRKKETDEAVDIRVSRGEESVLFMRIERR